MSQNLNGTLILKAPRWPYGSPNALSSRSPTASCGATVPRPNAIASLRRRSAEGVLIPLNHDKRPDCYLHRSNPNDVARTEQLTFVCTPTREEAGPTNNWSDPAETYAKMRGWFAGSMRGRTMYVVPYVMGPLGSPLSKVGVEITDSIYVALSMRIMTRMGARALEQLGASEDFNKGLHCTLDLNPERRLICHFPQDNTIWSAAAAMAATRCSARNVSRCESRAGPARPKDGSPSTCSSSASRIPSGETTYIAAAFPSACGKTNLAMLQPPPALAKQGWKVFTLGDDIAWLRVGPDGRLWAINPENGYFGVAPGTSEKSNYNAMKIARARFHFHQRRDDGGRRRLVGRHGRSRRRPASSIGKASPATPTRAPKPRIRTAASPLR